MKRPTPLPASKPKQTPKKAVRQRQAVRDKKFNPLEYLNSLIDDIHDHRSETTRRRTNSGTKRELSSALAYATPNTDRTISSSKLRSRSSYSQYRKKPTPLREVLRLDIEQAITEENNIRFTDASLPTPPPAAHPPRPPPSLRTRAAAARLIQRAWRNFQTLKVVRKYYQYYRSLMKRQAALRQQQLKVREGEQSHNRREFERTLKIRRGGEQSHGKTVRVNVGGVARSLEFSDELGSEGKSTKELMREAGSQGLNEMRTVELGREGPSALASRDLQFVIDLFRNSHQLAQNQINSHLDNFCKAQLSSQPPMSPEQSSVEEQQEGVPLAVFQEMERALFEKYELLRERAQRRAREADIGEQAARAQMGQLEGRLERELRSIGKLKEQYQRSMHQLKQNVLKMQGDCLASERLAVQLGKTSTKVRRCYSADTLILKALLQEVNLKSFDLQLPPPRYKPLVLEPAEDLQEPSLVFPTSPPSFAPNPPQGDSNRSVICFQADSDSKLREQIYNNSNFSEPLSQQKPISEDVGDFNDSMDIRCDSAESVEQKEDGLAPLRECSEQIQEVIEQMLVAEVVEEIYMAGKLLGGFKPFIETPFEFKQITDQDIYHFLQAQLPTFFQPLPQMLVKFNQKINPDSLEILRLIRDFEFEIDEYELVLPEEVFKAYRRQVEEDYGLRIKVESERQIAVEGVTGAIAVRALQRGSELRNKRVKFLSFQRDLKIMYMKSVFNCFNEFIIETKSFYTYMNGRSSIGPGELSLALKEYNCKCDEPQAMKIINEAKGRVLGVVRQKCMLPVFKNYKELECFQKQITRQIACELDENEYKWVNYMDEVLQIWQELSLSIVDSLLLQAAAELR